MGYQYRKVGQKLPEEPVQHDSQKQKNDRANEIALVVVFAGLIAMVVVRAFVH